MKKSEVTVEVWEAYKTYMKEWYKTRSVESKAAIIKRTCARSKAQTPEYHRNQHYKKKYGITIADYWAIHERQGGKCNLCGDVPTYLLNVEHDHITNRIRGLVCSPCNTVIGHLERHPGLVGAMSLHLEVI